MPGRTEVNHRGMSQEADHYELLYCHLKYVFFCSSRRRHTRFDCDCSSDVCSSDLPLTAGTTNLNLTIASGYDKPADQSAQIVASVTAPAITVSSQIIGNNMIVQGSISLGATPRSEERRVGKEGR